METKIDNSTVTISWQQITRKIEQLDQLKNSPDSINDIVAVTNSLHSLLMRRVAEQNGASNINTSKRVAVVMPSIFRENAVIGIPKEERRIMDEEVKAYGAPVDFGTSDTSENISLEDATVEEPVLDSISKMKEMEEDHDTKNDANTAVPPIEILEEKTPEPIAEETPVAEEYETENEPVAEDPTAPVDVPSARPEEPQQNKQYSIWEAYSSNDIPTLAQQQTTANTPIGKLQPAQETPSYNAATASAPIKDLRKAISISDRYLFINELFRGEESGYERSIKTINNFNVYQEARYWIDRELKVKMGWDDKSPAVKQFDSLVQRRFA